MRFSIVALALFAGLAMAAPFEKRDFISELG